ncbi:hypothetical protein BGX29_003461 [Mortierella sp. GBA35]|nr:hypothetical protein BGX29_003461 [Mortierella sp. GBA35]
MAADRSRTSISIKSVAGRRSDRKRPDCKVSFSGETDATTSSPRGHPATVPVPQSPPQPGSSSEHEDSSGEDEANTTFVTPHPVDSSDSASDNDDPVPVGPKQTLPTFFQDPPSTTSSDHLERHLAQLEARWNETCEELQETARKAEDTFSSPDMLEWHRRRCQWLQGQERSLREDIRRLIPLPSDPNLMPVHTAWTTYNETLRLYWSQHPYQRL